MLACLLSLTSGIKEERSRTSDGPASVSLINLRQTRAALMRFMWIQNNEVVAAGRQAAQPNAAQHSGHLRELQSPLRPLTSPPIPEPFPSTNTTVSQTTLSFASHPLSAP